jgi:hypothetical protein
MGEKFWIYDSHEANCQDFIDGILAANGMLTPEVHSWVKQDVSQLLSKLPGYTKSVSNAITSLAAKGHELIHGGQIRTRTVYVRHRKGEKHARVVVGGRLLLSRLTPAQANAAALYYIMHGH